MHFIYEETSNEVYQETNGSDYRGTVSTTINGRTCQEWTEQSPHSHSRTPENYPNSGLGDHNYCRNPDGVDGAWCYTTDVSVRWEYCDIGQPAEKGEATPLPTTEALAPKTEAPVVETSNEAYLEIDGSDYRGTVSTTLNGRTCQEWTEQSPHSHGRTPENYPNSGLGEHNYCRNPDGVAGAWCYTTDALVRWEYCDIGQPAVKDEPTLASMTEAPAPKTKAPEIDSSNEVYHETDGSDYRGTVSTTINGRTCQEWTEQNPHSHSRTAENYPNSGLGQHNYCRNPDGVYGAWCYTTDASVRWEYCDIGKPTEKGGPAPSPMTEDPAPKTEAPVMKPSNEVYHETDGSDYRGTVSTTINGRTCQEWTEQNPHSHSRTPENYPNSGLGEHNYCRNPDGVDDAWCYTTDASVRWEYCDIGKPAEKSEPSNEVYHESDGSDYRGIVSSTINGRTCQEWTEQNPHSHSRTGENYPNSGLGEHNYCRNPDGVDGAWCYTTDDSVRWEYCDIGKPAKKDEPSNEVYHETDGSDYRGTISTTINGRTCQEWTEQNPHSHSRTPDNYPNSGLGEHNYCRNPDGVDGAWCYTTDDSVRWEYCDIGKPARKGEPSNEVYHKNDGSDYRGTVSTTINGKTCQEWTEQNPHSHSRTPKNYPNSGLGEHNYCRNPDGTPGAWCYTTDVSVRWELCDIGRPAEKGGPLSEVYYENDGSDYRGTVSTTEHGKTCQEWTEQSPHSHTRTRENFPNAGLGQHNYCRNPDGTSGAWCYTTHPSVRWELCDIGRPDKNSESTTPLVTKSLATTTKFSVAGPPNEVYYETDGSDYRGPVATTINGRICQEWTEQSPHSHSRTPENYPNSGLGQHNYCRNPDGTSTVWCYTTDASVRWELCDIGKPDKKGEPMRSAMTKAQAPTEAPVVGTPNEVYYETDGSDYRGTVSTTINGRTCQQWTEQNPHSHSRTPENHPNSGLGEHNYCRNPDGVSGAWCYTTDAFARWELCDIGQPGENDAGDPLAVSEVTTPTLEPIKVQAASE
ncbi:apolipoprotein(a)-like [Ptychodera flava]|uniref:apolipoprotein(a)-like n=1 Tax=Ptychodera flava TaxID=63121 RepID=UPI00396A654F